MLLTREIHTEEDRIIQRRRDRLARRAARRATPTEQASTLIAGGLLTLAILVALLWSLT